MSATSAPARRGGRCDMASHARSERHLGRRSARHGPRSRAAGLAAAVGGCALAAASAVGPAPAAHAGVAGAGQGPASRAQESPPGTLVLVRQDFDVLDEPFTARVAIDPVLPAGTDQGSVSIVVTAYEPLLRAEDYDAAAQGQLGNPLDLMHLPLASASITDDGSRLVSVPLERDQQTPDALQLRRAGLYPIVFDVRIDGDSVATLQTYVNRLPDPAAGDPELARDDVMQFTLLIRITSPPTLHADGVEVDEATLDELVELVTLLESTTAPMTVTLPPELLDSLAETEPVLLSRLAAGLVGHELLAVPYVPFDPSSAVTVTGDAVAGIDGTETFTRLLREGEEALSATVSSASRRVGWVTTDDISTAGVAMLRDLGMRALVLPRELYERSEGNIGGYSDPSLFTATRLPDGSTIPTVVIDAAFSGALAHDGPYPEAAAIAFAADLVAWQTMFLLNDNAPRQHTMTVAMPDLGVPDAAFVARLMEIFTATPGIEPVPLSVAVDSTDPMTAPFPVVLTMPDAAGPTITARMQLVRDLTLGAISTRSMLPPEDPRPAEWDALLDRLPSTSLDDEGAAATADRLRREFGSIHALVVPPEPFAFTLSGDDSVVPLRFQNLGTEPIRVRLRLSSPKLTFPGGDLDEWLEPGVTTEVQVRVKALSNGRTPVSLDILTPEGDAPVTAQIPLTANVNALTGLAQVISLAGLALLVTWWAHHLRTTRKRRAAAAAMDRHPAAGDDDAAGDTPLGEPGADPAAGPDATSTDASRADATASHGEATTVSEP